MSDVADETYLGYTSSASPLLLWLTVSADWHSGDKHQFAAFVKDFKHPYGGESDDQVAALYVLGDDGPKDAVWSVQRVPSMESVGLLSVRCDAYDVDVIKEIQGWV